jgi:hypothetical protein
VSWPPAPRLATLAGAINQKMNGKFFASIEPGFCNTDRKIPGTRLRHPGKGRRGNKLVVRNRKGEIVLTHDSAETYRTNAEALEKVTELTGLTLADIMGWPK